MVINFNRSWLVYSNHGAISIHTGGRLLYMMPLSLAKPGETNYIKKITGNDGVRQHLAEMGFVVGTPVTVVTAMMGNLILQVKDCRVALNREMANRIMI